MSAPHHPTPPEPRAAPAGAALLCAALACAALSGGLAVPGMPVLPLLSGGLVGWCLAGRRPGGIAGRAPHDAAPLPVLLVPALLLPLLGAQLAGAALALTALSGLPFPRAMLAVAGPVLALSLMPTPFRSPWRGASLRGAPLRGARGGARAAAILAGLALALPALAAIGGARNGGAPAVLASLTDTPPAAGWAFCGTAACAALGTWAMRRAGTGSTAWPGVPGWLPVLALASAALVGLLGVAVPSGTDPAALEAALRNLAGGSPRIVPWAEWRDPGDGGAPAALRLLPEALFLASPAVAGWPPVLAALPALAALLFCAAAAAALGRAWAGTPPGTWPGRWAALGRGLRAGAALVVAMILALRAEASVLLLYGWTASLLAGGLAAPLLLARGAGRGGFRAGAVAGAGVAAALIVLLSGDAAALLRWAGSREAILDAARQVLDSPLTGLWDKARAQALLVDPGAVADGSLSWPLRATSATENGRPAARVLGLDGAGAGLLAAPFGAATMLLAAAWRRAKGGR